MNTYSALYHRHFHSPRFAAIIAGGVLYASAVGWPSDSRAQLPLPTETVAVSASPTPASPDPTATPALFDFAAYTKARTPAANVAITFASAAAIPTQNLLTQLTQTGAATALIQPQTVGRVFSVINLGTLSGNTPPPPAVVTLQFDPARAGANVWVQTLDGGTLQTLGTDGQPVTIQGGYWGTLNAAGQLTFTFQAPSACARYQVVVRLDNVSTIVPFVVPEPPEN